MSNQTKPQKIDAPAMENSHYGIRVSHIGEDGDLIALGHHSDRRSIAAFNRHMRTFLGLANLADDRSATAAEWVPALQRRHCIFRTPDPENCWEDVDWSWVAEWCQPETPDAHPVTLLRF
ncbi:hypothetical protein KVH31_34945 [Streptomyces olivaceus]|uniref:hypothetical protein n=1 Tax=Streptomyces olivaceus TaxID=47716 RepID=UPI001CCD5E5A|nr:hypothetical protein [Streptomyces olivaceus]MBZ6211696.1 hypothetical protein [Streptomyces olivaceus]